MTATVNLYKISYRSPVRLAPVVYSLQPLGSSWDETEALCEGPIAYTLPDGYSVGETVAEEPAIFNAQRRYVEIATHERGMPQLIGPDTRPWPVLRPAMEG